MSRELYKDVLVTDQLPVWEPDGVTKHSGLTAGNFTVVGYLDGVEVGGFASAISEIGGRGEYAITWTPDSVGFWVVEVRNDYNGETHEGQYDIVLPALIGVV